MFALNKWGRRAPWRPRHWERPSLIPPPPRVNPTCQDPQSTFPLFQWRLLYRRRQQLLAAMRRIDMASRRLHAPLQSDAPNVRALVTGSAILRQVGQFASECAECYQQFEQDIYAEVNLGSKQSHRKRAAIVRVSATFFKWKGVALRCRQLRFAFLEEVIDRYDLEGRGRGERERTDEGYIDSGGGHVKHNEEVTASRRCLHSLRSISTTKFSSRRSKRLRWILSRSSVPSETASKTYSC